MGKKTVSCFTIASNDDHPINIEELQKRCDKWAYIRHDSPEENEPHTHFVGFLTHNTRTTVDYIAKWAGLDANMVEIVRSKVGILNYLDHHKEKNKVHYDPSKVVSNFDISTYVEKEETKVSRKARWEEIIAGIEQGVIAEYNVYDYVSMDEYVNYKNKLDLAFRYKHGKEQDDERDMQCVYLHGASGSGKTTLAKQLAQNLGMKFYKTSSGKNSFDNYEGQPFVLMDDGRPSDWKFNDFLKLTDNNTSSMIGCRYYNKHFNKCKVLVVTNCDSLDKWYSQLQENDNEAKQQLLRRFTTDIEVYGIREINGEAYADCKINSEPMYIKIDEQNLVSHPIDFRQFAVVPPTVIKSNDPIIAEMAKDNGHSVEEEIKEFKQDDNFKVIDVTPDDGEVF